jgi:LAO/AO transport system kinase
MPSEESAGELAERVLSGDRGAVSDALNLVDDDRPDRRERALALLDALEGRGAGARVGITGAPGAGKSSLLDAMVSELRRRDRSVGILAVDPSSQRTGGALLGDRMRLGSGARDSGVFLRSLAARDRLGGLSEVTGPSLDILIAAFDTVFIETVGVGQSEAEVIDLVDSLVFVAQPAAGDLIQFMKAGILEWPDIFFVNKSDLGDAATRTATELRAGLDLSRQRDVDFVAPVLSGSARDGVGIAELIDALDAHAEHLRASGAIETRRERGRIARVRNALSTQYGRFGLRRLGAKVDLESFVRAHPDISAQRIVSELGSVVEKALAANGR